MFLEFGFCPTFFFIKWGHQTSKSPFHESFQFLPVIIPCIIQWVIQCIIPVVIHNHDLSLYESNIPSPKMIPEIIRRKTSIYSGFPHDVPITTFSWNIPSSRASSMPRHQVVSRSLASKTPALLGGGPPVKKGCLTEQKWCFHAAFTKIMACYLTNWN